MRVGHQRDNLTYVTFSHDIGLFKNLNQLWVGNQGIFIYCLMLKRHSNLISLRQTSNVTSRQEKTGGLYKRLLSQTE